MPSGCGLNFDYGDRGEEKGLGIKVGWRETKSPKAFFDVDYLTTGWGTENEKTVVKRSIFCCR